MKSFSFDRAVCAVIAVLTGCGGSQPPIGAPIAIPRVSMRAPSPTNYSVVYSFGALPDGSNPNSSLIDVRGTLYGTTEKGGTNSCADSNTCGTVFSVTPGGSEKVLYSFGPPPDGSYPDASLLAAGNMLYGTTYAGGLHRDGTVFDVSTSGSESVLHSFNGANGKKPAAALVDVNGTFYGTTSGGGANDCGTASSLTPCGTVFRVSPSGEEHVVFSFVGGRDGKGWLPQAGLIDANDVLYGTAYLGGHYFSGVVFSVTTSGIEKVLHSFGKGTDGANPNAALIEVNGTFYGTTRRGGAYSCGSGTNCGTVFSITPDGKEKVIHSFGSGTDGRTPNASLIDVKGTLYGTTSDGGEYSSSDCNPYHPICGTVFSITTAGTEKVIHSFGSGTDGSSPNAGLIDVKGKLYGTTSRGGMYDNGTVFALTP